ncbi:DNA mismatch repair protein MLH3 isoform X2 [Malania oleifera]|uniref:DNA mismatch repair protein MLH3 isoform X2 n=1 Tax=Malania oleifera TaxID=397392 RepID=UPI0025AE4A5E|nr:DNA mismatch repair protein MLH3 isoform X2 [Malania oleifera]
MKSIKHLPETVYSSLRSSIILSDLTRVVEELVFNSLDAGARKRKQGFHESHYAVDKPLYVSIYIGIGTCYVKVVDNGSGITRDGLVLLGERYATSKINSLDDMDSASGSFGFRGEALCSISDVSLLEIETKAHGRPNGFRKVMKGCKCLYLGIDDDKQDAGTTVIVRDLFYNQPVRRKQMQSSPKKILHSVKKCVLQIALVHSMVSFKVVDIESEDDLLGTQPSPSPLTLLTSVFGIEVSSSLHEVNLSGGALKLSGYVSGPSSTSSVKGFQYVYINSQFVRQGPIHKLLNQLASRFNSLDPLKSNIWAQNMKRSRFQVSPIYILNLSCPRSSYDLSFDPLKTSVEFKDWGPILNFIEKAITNLWNENLAHGTSCIQVADTSKSDEMCKEGDNIIKEEDLLANSEVAIERCKVQNLQSLLELPSDSMEFLTEESDHMSHWKDDRIFFQKSQRNPAELKGQQTEMGFVHQTDCSFQFMDSYVAKCVPPARQESDNHLWTPDNNSLSSKDNFFKKDYAATERSSGHVEENIFDSRRTEFHKLDANMSNTSTRSILSCDSFEFGNEFDGASKDIRKPFLQNCSSLGSLPNDETLFLMDKGFDYNIEGFMTKRRRIDPAENFAVVEADGGNKRFFESLPEIPWRDDATSALPSSGIITKCDIHTDVDSFSRDSLRSFLLNGDRFVGGNDFPPTSVSQTINCGSDTQTDSEWSSFSLSSDLLYGTTSWNDEDFTHENACKRSSKSSRSTSYGHFVDMEQDCVPSSDFKPTIDIEENCFSICRNTRLDLKGFVGPRRESGEFLKPYNLDDMFCPSWLDVLTNKADWLCLNSHGSGKMENCAVPSHHSPSFMYIDDDKNQRGQQRYQDCPRNYVPKERVRRSHSAPPFYRGKKRFIALNSHWPMKAERANTKTLPEASQLKHCQQISGTHSCIKPSLAADYLFHARPDTMKIQNFTSDLNESEGSEKFIKSHCHRSCLINFDKDSTSIRTQDSTNSGVKWQFSDQPTASGDKSQYVRDQCGILDISSGILHLAHDSLIPEAISKKCLENAKVLQQVDKKFIPIVADETLAIIDQHAADERIRLEELRQKVLSGEEKTITYLDAEQELVLPEIGYQLLHNYAEQIKKWGWICNIHSQNSRSFKKDLTLLQGQPTVITLLAVPCILGVNLSDVDLLEFLQQLSDTDGSSTMPPSILRVLNLKACRGAIMFGDALLPSECSLLLDELKRTSLCFQCAHGRPTTAPLVNLEALHKEIAKLGSNVGSSEPWHGLQQHPPSLKRAAQRLKMSRGQH